MRHRTATVQAAVDQELSEAAARERVVSAMRAAEREGTPVMLPPEVANALAEVSAWTDSDASKSAARAVALWHGVVQQARQAGVTRVYIRMGNRTMTVDLGALR